MHQQAHRKWATLLGGIFWVALATVLIVAASRPVPPATASTTDLAPPRPIRQLADYWTTPSATFQLSFPEVAVRAGDPIIAEDAAGGWQQVGYLTWTDSSRRAAVGRAVWHHPQLAPDAFEFEYQYNRGRFDDVLRTLLPPEKRERLEQLIRETIDRHGDEITAALRPIVTRSLRESLPVVEDAFRDAVARHRDEIEALGERYRAEILEQRILPLVKDEVVPIVRQHGEPVANEIGRELWGRASIWRFAWRGIYDRTPLPERELLRQEWERYFEEEATPVLDRYMPDLIEAQKKILLDVSKNQRVRDELSEVASEMARDPELRDLVTAILRETFVENEPLRQVWIDQWKSAEAQAALDLAGERLEPLVRQIGDELFGTRKDGINPDFARVLRNQILGKDKRWLVATRVSSDRESATSTNGSTGSIPVSVAEGSSSFPMIVLAAPEEPPR